jgi:hypothetical protein
VAEIVGEFIASEFSRKVEQGTFDG